MSKSPPTVLIVDERALVRRTIALALKSDGLSTVEAANGYQALDLLRNHPDVDLVIATIEMAGMTGIELARRLKSEDKYQSIPVILRTRGEDLESGMLKDRVESLLDESGSPRPRQVLVLSTSTETKAQLRSALAEIGFRVFEVRSASEAAQALEDVDGLDLAFVDFRLASNQASEFIRHVRSQQGNRRLRLVMLMSELNVTQVIEGVRGGVDHYLLQPVSREKLFGRLKDLGLDGPGGSLEW
jgi:CheY-like chemotaxis protein